MTLDSQDRALFDKFEAAICAIPEITECYPLAGQHDYFLRVVYRDTADLEHIHSEVLTPLRGVVRVRPQLTRRTVKRTPPAEAVCRGVCTRGKSMPYGMR